MNYVFPNFISVNFTLSTFFSEMRIFYFCILYKFSILLAYNLIIVLYKNFNYV